MIEFKNVYKAYKNKPVLSNISLTIQDDEFFVLIGSSGCGKTTLLKMINKLNSIDQGKSSSTASLWKEYQRWTCPGGSGNVVQERWLFPHMTIGDNIALTMQLAGIPKERILPRVNEMLEMVSLDPGTYRDLYPSQLSGGQRQRVGVARAFAPRSAHYPDG